MKTFCEHFDLTGTGQDTGAAEHAQHALPRSQHAPSAQRYLKLSLRDDLRVAVLSTTPSTTASS